MRIGITEDVKDFIEWLTATQVVQRQVIAKHKLWLKRFTSWIHKQQDLENKMPSSNSFDGLEQIIDAFQAFLTAQRTPAHIVTGMNDSLQAFKYWLRFVYKTPTYVSSINRLNAPDSNSLDVSPTLMSLAAFFRYLRQQGTPFHSANFCLHQAHALISWKVNRYPQPIAPDQWIQNDLDEFWKRYRKKLRKAKQRAKIDNALQLYGQWIEKVWCVPNPFAFLKPIPQVIAALSKAEVDLIEVQLTQQIKCAGCTPQQMIKACRDAAMVGLLLQGGISYQKLIHLYLDQIVIEDSGALRIMQDDQELRFPISFICRRALSLWLKLHPATSNTQSTPTEPVLESARPLLFVNESNHAIKVSVVHNVISRLNAQCGLNITQQQLKLTARLLQSPSAH